MTKSVRDPRYVEVIGKLRLARRTAGFTQESLAFRLGMPQSYISKVESGERRIDVVELIDLCGVLGVALEDVLPYGQQKGARNDHR